MPVADQVMWALGAQTISAPAQGGGSQLIISFSSMVDQPLLSGISVRLAASSAPAPAPTLGDYSMSAYVCMRGCYAAAREQDQQY